MFITRVLTAPFVAAAPAAETELLASVEPVPAAGEATLVAPVAAADFEPEGSAEEAAEAVLDAEADDAPDVLEAAREEPETLAEVELVEVLFEEAAPTSAPTPHGMASPLGSLAFSGAVLCPEADAMVNRVVHSVLEDAGLVNW